MDVNGLRFWMLSQSTDWLAPWRARSAYVLGQSLLDPNGHIQTVQTAGVSDAAPPAWNPAFSQATRDGGVTWMHAGPAAWAASTSFPAGSYILDANNNLQTVTALANAALPSTSAAAAPEWPMAFGEEVADGNLVWRCAGPSQTGLDFCATNKRLILRSTRSGAPPVEDFALATRLVETVPLTLDTFGNYARWDAAAGIVVAGGSGPSTAGADEYQNEASPALSEVPIYFPPRPTVSDLAMGEDGILYIASAGSLVMLDRRGRWRDFTLTLAEFSVWRIAALPGGGVLALDRANRQLGLFRGQPLYTGPTDATDPSAPKVLRPCNANDDPPRLVARVPLPQTEEYISVASLDAGTAGSFAVLSWASNTAVNKNAYLRTVTATGSLISLATARLQLAGVVFPYAVTSLGSGKIAALATNLNESLVYNLPASNEGPTATLLPAGDTYILSAANLGPFVHVTPNTASSPPQYANAGSTGVSPSVPLYFPLLPLSLANVAAAAASLPTGPAIIDSGNARNVWHRLFIEAVVPPRCGAVVWLAASDSRTDLYLPSTPWFPHLLGDALPASVPAAMLPNAATAVWQSTSSEVSYAPALLTEDPIPGRQGLFMALIQRPNRSVRSLSGRFLAVRIQLNGDGRNTAEIAGIRFHGSRFSYVQNYLPEPYRESTFGPEADREAPSTRQDFFERFVDIFEYQFTRIENQIAKAYLLTRVEAVPEAALPWLGGWIGVPQDDSYPPTRSRARLKATPALYRSRGTIKGITLALDVATGGMCRRGAVVLVEDFRLRHIFATILGADLAIKSDPMLPGYSASSNSIVGDTLFLGDPHMQAEIQALYAADLGIDGGSEAAQELYDSLAHRLTVFVHNQVENVDFKLVQRIVDAEKPAHVKVAVLRASQAFLIGMASLLGVNSYLAPEQGTREATIDLSSVGGHDLVTHEASLDPRFENGVDYAEYARPIARIVAPTVFQPNQTIVLDGSASTSPPGTQIQSYAWTLLP